MKKERKNKGITLIALIITIIVMLILVGVTVNVALNGGLFDVAKQAASGMNMSQIREKAEMAKVVLIADAQTDSGIIANIPTYRDRLLEEFDAKETDTNGDNIIEVNDKYVIIIKNSDLDIEVFEKTKIPANYLLISLGYETSNIEENGKNYGINVALNITRLMNEEEYALFRAEKEITEEMRYEIVLEYLIDEIYSGEEFTSIDEMIVYDINDWYTTEYTNIEECLQDETVKAEWGTTKEQLYYTFCTYETPNEGNKMTEEQVVDYWYQDAINEKYRIEYNKNTNNMSLHIVINGVEQIPIAASVAGKSRTIYYSIVENGTYEFILKSYDNEEIAREVLRVNNITTDENPYYMTVEEAEGIWTTNGRGEIKGYEGTDTQVIVPIKIGEETITGVRGFEYNKNITNVKVPNGITTIGANAFYGCGNLTDIIIPNSVTIMGTNAFYGCTNLINIYFGAGRNPIPNEDNKPWGAPNENVQVIKLEQ